MHLSKAARQILLATVATLAVIALAVGAAYYDQVRRAQNRANLCRVLNEVKSAVDAGQQFNKDKPYVAPPGPIHDYAQAVLDAVNKHSAEGAVIVQAKLKDANCPVG